jgi:hypothetical protein
VTPGGDGYCGNGEGVKFLSACTADEAGMYCYEKYNSGAFLERILARPDSFNVRGFAPCTPS